jgi:hypothetical protein
MNNNPESATNEQQPKAKKSRYPRPLLFSALCGGALIYSVLMVMLFTAGLIKNRWLTNVLTDFFPDRFFTYAGTLFFTITGLVVHLISISGLILLIRLRRTGFYLFTSAIVLIIVVPYLYGSGNWLSGVIFTSLLILISFFFKKLT